MNQHDISTQPSDQRPSGLVNRRTVVRAAAWSVPVIAIVTAAPAAAASDGTTTLIRTSWDAAQRVLLVTVLLSPAPGATPTITLASPNTALSQGSTTAFTGGMFQLAAVVAETYTETSLPISVTTAGFSTLNATVDLASAGSIDGGFPPHLNHYVEGLAVQGDGKILVAGYFTFAGGDARNRIARFNSDGSLDTTFNPGTGLSSAGFVVAVQSDGRILVTGGFRSVGGTAIDRIARLNTDGSLDTTFNPGTGVSSAGSSLAVQGDGRILVGGSFAAAGTTEHRFAVRLNTDGSLDTTFNPGTGRFNSGYDVAVLSDGRILVTGYFTTVDGVAQNRIARLNTDGSLDTSFDPGAGLNDAGSSIVEEADGKILIAGSFTTVDGVARNRIARLNPDGSLDTTFNPGSGLNNNGNVITEQANGKILVGGYFTTVDGTTQRYLARLHG